MKCLYCGSEFEADRNTAKYCKKECRIRHKHIKRQESGYYNKYFQDENKLIKRRETVRDCQRRRRKNPETKEKMKMQSKIFLKKIKKDKERKVYYDKMHRKAHIKHQMKKYGKINISFVIIDKRMNFFDGKCCYCNGEKPLTLEHLQSYTEGGTNAENNIYGACLWCNCSKNNTQWQEWFRKQPFYSIERENEIIRYNRV